MSLEGKKKFQSIFIDADPIAISIIFFFILFESSKHKTRSPDKQVEPKSKNKCLLLLQQKLFCFSICWFSGFIAQNTRARLLSSFGSLSYSSPRKSFCDTGKLKIQLMAPCTDKREATLPSICYQINGFLLRPEKSNASKIFAEE